MAFLAAMQLSAPTDLEKLPSISKSIGLDIVDETRNRVLVLQYLELLQAAALDAACQEVCRLASLVKTILRLHPRDVNLNQTFLDFSDSLSTPLYYASFLYAAWRIVQTRASFASTGQAATPHFQVLTSQVVDCIGKKGPYAEFTQVVEGFAAGHSSPLLQNLVNTILSNVRNNVYVSTAGGKPALEFTPNEMVFETAAQRNDNCKPVFFSDLFIQDIRTGVNSLRLSAAQHFGARLVAPGKDRSCSESDDIVVDHEADNMLMSYHGDDDDEYISAFTAAQGAPDPFTGLVVPVNPAMSSSSGAEQDAVAKVIADMPTISQQQKQKKQKKRPVQVTRLEEVTRAAESSLALPTVKPPKKTRVGTVSHIDKKMDQQYIDIAPQIKVEQQYELFTSHTNRQIVVVLDGVEKDNIVDLAIKVKAVEMLLADDHVAVHAARHQVRRWCKQTRDEINKLHALRELSKIR